MVSLPFSSAPQDGADSARFTHEGRAHLLHRFLLMAPTAFGDKFLFPQKLVHLRHLLRAISSGGCIMAAFRLTSFFSFFL
jgi:hypothetical protein